MQSKKANSNPQNLPGVRLSAEQTKAVSSMTEIATKETAYRYPWDALEGDLEDRGLLGIPVVCYGSLINAASAAQTLHEQTLRTSKPVITFGARRLFNYEMPLNSVRYGSPINPLARAALNVRITGIAHDVINGVLMNLALADIPAIREREKEYDLVPVVCLGWNELQKPPFLAHIFSCPDDLRKGKRLTNNKISPHREYYLLCRKGASKVGEEFLRLWLTTTYLADGITPVAQWEATEFTEIS